LKSNARPIRPANNYANLAFGECASVIGADYSGHDEHFIDHPAAPEELDWQAVKRDAGIS